MKKRILKIMLAFTVLTSMSNIHGNSEIVLAADNSAAVTLTSKPEASAEYKYSPDVSCGTLRYISQVSGEPAFYSEYWGVWEGQAGSECLSASMSMALSYIGVNITPKDILDCGGGITRAEATWGGAPCSTIDVATAIDNYINGDGKYSPPIIHLNSYSGYGHYVVLAGQISPTEYQVLDPSISEVWNIRFDGNTVTYTVYNSTYTDTVTTAYQYYNSKASLPPTLEELQEEIAKEDFIINGPLNTNSLNLLK